MSTAARKLVSTSLLCLLVAPGLAEIYSQAPVASLERVPEAETLIVNAKVYTVNSRQPWAEGVAMAAAAAKSLAALSEMGVRLSLDDFGTGYSSLLYLMRLPVDEIKIDRSFVSGLATDPDSGAIVRAAVGLGHNLGLRVVAEGLQDRAAEAILLDAGCDAAQGFLVGRPMDEPEVTALLLEHFALIKLEGAPGRAPDGASGTATDRASGQVATTAEQGHPVDLESA